MPTTLHIYDVNDFGPRKWGYLGSDRPGIVWTSVASLQDIQNEIARVGGLGGGINELWFHMHGSPGIVWLKTGYFSADQCMNIYTVGQLKPVCLHAMAPKARISFTACNLGEGPQGADFLRAAGPAMLSGGGGIMLAPTALTVSDPLFGEWLPRWSDVRVAQVSPGGAVIISQKHYTPSGPMLPPFMIGPGVPTKRPLLPPHIR